MAAGMNVATARRWLRKFVDNGNGSSSPAAEAHDDELERLRAELASQREQSESDAKKIKRLETYVENVNKQALMLGNQLAFANCVTHGIVEPFLTTDEHYKLSYANANLAALSGFPEKHMLGRSLDEVLRIENPAVMQAIKNCYARGEATTGQKVDIRIADGSVRRFLVNAGPLKRSTGEAVGLYCILQDITEVEGAEEKARLLEMLKEATVALTSATVQILTTVSQQNTALAEQASAVAQTSATIKEVREASVQAADRAKNVITLAERSEQTSTEGQAAIEQILHAMDEINSRVEGIASNVVELSERASQIGNIATTVNELAEKTNMLALNASIEAAKAGDFGRGFAVVAQEMRALADQSKRATQQIRDILGDVQKVVRSVVVATEEGSSRAERGASLTEAASKHITVLGSAIKDSSSAARQIAMAARQQSVGFEQVSGAMGNISQATKDSVAGIKQLESAARELKTLSDRMEGLLLGP